MEDPVYELFYVDKAPKVFKPYPPEYPLSAIVNNISRGRVVARFVVTKEGKTKNINSVCRLKQIALILIKGVVQKNNYSLEY